MSKQAFGGDWTEDKLRRVREYLEAYMKVMKYQSFYLVYIDAFAGTGYRTLKHDEKPNEPLFPELLEQEPRKFLEGSATIALKVEPPFHEYIFIEKDPGRFNELQKLKKQFPSRNIRLEQGDANDYISRLCQAHGTPWLERRAVLFLDPFGMQVTWETVETIAKTKAIDLWYLFPLIAVHRLLRRDPQQMNEAERKRLDDTFGASDWFDAFYEKQSQLSLFPEDTPKVKIADHPTISQYFVNRLQTVFPAVAENPLALYNSRNTPLYLLCFAAANETGGKIAIKIAQHILKPKT